MRRVLTAGALAVTLALAGCAGQPSYASVAGKLQDSVLLITTDAASGNLQSALRDVYELTARVEAAKAGGQISSAKYQQITAAIAKVQEKLIAQLTAAGQTPAPAPTRSSVSGSSGTSSSGNSGGGTSSPSPQATTAPKASKAPKAPSTGGGSGTPAPPASAAPSAPASPAPTPSDTPPPSPTPTPSETAQPTQTPAATAQSEQKPAPDSQAVEPQSQAAVAN